MIVFLRNWIKNIVVVIILAMFLELLLPKSEMQKYVKMVLGLLVILLVLNPVLDLIKQNFSFGERILEIQNTMELDNIMTVAQNLEQNNKKNILKTYKEGLNKQVEAQVMTFDEIKEAEAYVVIDENMESENFGQIQEIKLCLQFDAEQSNTSIIEPIEKIEIGIGNRVEELREQNVNKENISGIIKKVVGKLSDYYNIAEKKITIVVLEEGN